MAIFLEGKEIARDYRRALAQKVQNQLSIGNRVPHLAIILIGQDPASHTYVQYKIKACREVGFQVTLIQETAIDESLLIRLIAKINQDKAVDGLIVQLPLPPYINAQRILQAIKPEKDVDGLHALNYGRMACNLPSYIPATPLGILMLLERYQINLQGKHCVVVGRGPTVGAPLSILLGLNANPGNATVTLCHSYTENLAKLTCQADILIVAMGKPAFIKAHMVQKGAVVVDVGITRVPDLTKKSRYRLQGDIDFDAVAPKCSYITPVPGGVGPMTIVALLTNTLRAAQNLVYG
jgi:methylenetetrahydrofolate dehydrogenase (NADP+)/methenyltetrahydrofolate cyclohydrolase